MTKTHILAEIRRTALANGGEALGWRRFEAETGIRKADWIGVFWARWSDAVREAGLTPNELKKKYELPDLVEMYAALARELGWLPSAADLKMKRTTDPQFPDPSTFERLGSKSDLVKQLAEHCRSTGDMADVLALCEAYPSNTKASPQEGDAGAGEEIGFVYLMKSGRFYKIGRSNSAGRREYELGLQLPEPITMIHAIRTDDPVGIEAYWHNRFAAKRKNGEWFELDAGDVAAFKRRKFM